MSDFEVTVYEDGTAVETVEFATLEEAERFSEERSERLPAANCVIEDRTRDHTAWQAVEDDTAVAEDYPRSGQTD